MLLLKAPVSELLLITNRSTVTSSNVSTGVVEFNLPQTDRRPSPASSTVAADSYVACRAVGGNPTPRLRLSVGRTDVTAQFELTATSPSKTGDDDGGGDGSGFTQLVSARWAGVERAAHGRTMKCVARVETGRGRQDIKTVAVATIDVRCE